MQTFWLHLRQQLIRALLILLVLTPISFAQAPNPQSGNIDVTSNVGQVTPTEAAIITDPVRGQRFSQAQITVKGTCPAGVTVEIYKNGIFAGSSLCQDQKFSLQISLVPGKNVLVARVRSISDIYGPDSSPIDVYYDVITSTSTSTTAAAAAKFPALLLTTDVIYRGLFVHNPLTFKLEIIGGLAPYAVKIEWGDGNDSLLVRETSGSFTTQYTYEGIGPKVIKVTATDKTGQVSTIQTLAIINGELAQDTGTPSIAKDFWRRLAESAWPLSALLALVILAFWLGYRYRTRHEELLQSSHSPVAKHKKS